MLTVEELQAALNDPSSPMREKLLNYLSMSPLDPAKAYDEILKGENPAQGGMPQAAAQPQQGFAELMAPQQDLSREANPMGVVNLANSAEVLPPPNPLVAGAPAAMDPNSLKALFEGLAGGGGGEKEAPIQFPPASAPRGNNWNTFTAAPLQSSQFGGLPSLAELLEGRGRR